MSEYVLGEPDPPFMVVINLKFALLLVDLYISNEVSLAELSFQLRLMTEAEITSAVSSVGAFGGAARCKEPDHSSPDSPVSASRRDDIDRHCTGDRDAHCRAHGTAGSPKKGSPEPA